VITAIFVLAGIGALTVIIGIVVLAMLFLNKIMHDNWRGKP